jgi:hypothetical protein
VGNESKSNLANLGDKTDMSYKKKDITLLSNQGISAELAFENYSEYNKSITNYSLPKPFDFSLGDNALYGKSDLVRDYVQPIKNRLKPIGENQNKQVVALDFVVDAYKDFEVFLKQKKKNKLVDDLIISQDWRVEVGWEDIDTYYDQKMQQIYQSFVRNYLVPSGKEKEIRNFDDFLKIFMNHFYQRINIPITKTGFVSSKNVGPHFSGLCLRLSNEYVSDYANKYNKFVNSKNFELFSKAAAQFGFMVDYHAPWRLVANLNSPKLYPYILDRIKLVNLVGSTDKTFGNSPSHSHEYELDGNLNGVTKSIIGNNVPDHVHEIKDGIIVQSQYYSDQIPNTVHVHDVSYGDNSYLKISDVYGIYFYKTSYFDIDTLKEYFVGMYNAFARNFPASIIVKPCYTNQYTSIGKGHKTNTTTVTRDVIDNGYINQNYDDVFWYKLYFNIRLKEVGAKVTNAQVSNAMKKMEEYYFFVDEERAIRYIQQYLKQFY